MDTKESEWAKRDRIVFEYNIPESLGGGKGGVPQKVSMTQLTAEQELQASKIGRFDMMKAQYVATKMSIVEMDGKAPDKGGGGLDSFWERCDPRLRSLLLQAYNKISSPTKEEEEGFFGSEVVRV
jgi:hypothetical protein